MSVVISAIFDSVDTADFALADLKRSGFVVEACRIHPLDPQQSDRLSGPLVGLANQTTNVQAGIVAFSGSIATDNGIDLHDDTHTREVVMLATIPENSACDAQGVLVSSGGRQVHQI